MSDDAASVTAAAILYDLDTDLGLFDLPPARRYNKGERTFAMRHHHPLAAPVVGRGTRCTPTQVFLLGR